MFPFAVKPDFLHARPSRRDWLRLGIPALAAPAIPALVQISQLDLPNNQMTILTSQIDLTGDWQSWRDGPPVTVLRPERPWEGANTPMVPSVRSTAYGQVNQLRDPAIFEDDGRVYLLYAVAGESGIAIAELITESMR